VDKDDRPVYPPRVLSAEVLHSPFEDIVPRDRKARGQDAAKAKPKERGTK
jgi:peptidyl-prolyl cis-trans isomerase SDCCAG10